MVERSGMTNPVEVGSPLSLLDLEDVALRRRPVVLANAARAKVAASRAAVEAVARAGDDAPRVYGINTGFGALSETRIGASDVRDLQRNLVRSHSTGVGPNLSIAEVRGMMLLRAQVVALGHSGVRPLVVDLLLGMLNAGVHPRIPAQGSVGASGDLAPLAHLALTVIGEGEASVDDGRTYIASAEALAHAGLKPVTLEAKEGLALINGTQYMASLGVLALLAAERLCALADVAGAMSLEALKGSSSPFDARLQAARPHPGQARVAGNLRKLLADSAIAESHRDCGKVQDAYSLRCMPQVHGASRDALAYVRGVLEIEVNSVTDNPSVFLRDGKHAEDATTVTDEMDIISGGNFHGQPLAIALDMAAIANRGAGQHQRATHGAAGEPGALHRSHAVPRRGERAALGVHDRPGDQRVAGEREQGALSSGQRGFDPLVGRQGGSREHGQRERAQARDDRRQRAHRAGHRGDDRRRRPRSTRAARAEPRCRRRAASRPQPGAEDDRRPAALPRHRGGDRAHRERNAGGSGGSGRRSGGLSRRTTSPSPP